MKKILLVEDEKELGENIRDLLQALGYIVVGIFDKGSTVIDFLEKNPVDLILMDVMIKGDLDGIQLTEKIKSIYDIPIIFLTAFSDQNVLERISNGKYEGYLLKPFSLQSLKSAVYLGLNKKPKDETQENHLKSAIKVRDKGYVIHLPYHDILFIEADGLYCKIITLEKTYVVRGILKDILNGLDDKKFIRVHKSFCINVDKIHSLNAKELLIGTFVIPIRRGFYKELLELIKR
ncbi:LytR/AlgR family response regulator transcription factor [Mongoliitalea daihaiensis]|uniref:LytR/AlgR family response regulator transcription factor n=1 Tax=Mongoliitalea daihaiensis TaxID=2782006 RepID=UPI001F348A38|nr:response regulator [Mongoliitalea daihaiensis]UJP65216.1 response regulator [Mongoliitalea daihaiensis]